MTRPSMRSGFSLVELLVVIAILATLAAIVIPGLASSRVVSNESATIEHLRSVASGQATVKHRLAIETEVPPDGDGEYAYLAELAGSVPLRGSGAKLDPPAAGARFGIVQQSVVTAAGYHIAVFLPDAAGAGLPEDPNGGAGAAAVDPELAERYWLCYAWPARLNQSGNRAFVINQTGDILATDNVNQKYSGLTSPPPFDAAFLVPGDMTGRLAVGQPGADGGLWKPVR